LICPDCGNVNTKRTDKFGYDYLCPNCSKYFNNEFNIEEGQQLRNEGRDLAIGNKAEWLEIGQNTAVKIALSRPDRECWADLVHQVLRPMGIFLSMASGSLFKDKKKWIYAGRMEQSTLKQYHRRETKVWKLKYGYEKPKRLQDKKKASTGEEEA